MKAISSRLKVLNEDLVRSYKGRIKIEPLLPLKQFEPVSGCTVSTKVPPCSGRAPNLRFDCFLADFGRFLA
jgi:hypothetical protein